jgi:murein DD-endopeptidase MepM/ murein hydrolase activator NlpD
LFTDRDQQADGPQGDYPPVDLSRKQMLAEPAPQRITRVSSLAERYGEWRARTSVKLSEWDLAPDLAQHIGSRRWLRGAFTLVGLTAVALAAWPGFSPVEAAPAMRIDDRVRDEFRSQMIMPLALGADSGRRMGTTQAVRELARAPERPSLDLVATLTQGDGFARMLQRAGVGAGEAGQIAAMVAGAIPLSEIKPGTQIDITLGRRPAPNVPRPVDALSFRARFDLQLAVERRGERLVLDPRPIQVDATPLRIRGTVGDGLYRSARAAGAPPSAVQQYLRALGGELNLDRDITATDEFDLIVDYKRAATGEVEVGEVQYAALLRGGRPHKQLMRWGREGRFYDTSGVGEVREGLIAPVAGSVSSNYGMRRHPILGYRRMHAGMDFRARSGTPIYAATDGRVEFAGRHGGHGNFVRLRHAGNLGTGYAHMSRIAVSAGQQVRRGQVIGYVGSTGLSTGPHLHYEMYRGGQTVDPASVRFVTRAELSGQELANFRAQLARLTRVAPGAALTSLASDTAVEEEPVREIGRLENRRRVD